MRSIKLQITLQVGIGVVVAFAALTGYISWFVRQQLVDHASASGQVVAVTMAEKLDGSLRDLRDSARVLAAASDKGQVLRDLGAAYVVEHPGIQRIGVGSGSDAPTLVAAQQGKATVTTMPDELRQQVAGRLNQAGPKIWARQADGKLVPSILLKTPTGFVYVEGIPIPGTQAADQLGLGLLNVMVVDPQGVVLLAPDASLVGKPVPAGTPLTLAFAAKPTGQVQEVFNVFNSFKRMLIFRADLTEVGWKLALFADRGAVTAASQTMVAVIIAFAIVGLLVIGNLLYIQIATATAPLVDLGEACDSVATGDLDDAAAVVDALQIRGDNELTRLKNAFGNMVADLKRANKELEIATRIQTALLPKDLGIQGYELSLHLVPASEVGGDLIDYVPGDHGRFWLAVGDVTGHGLTSGLITMMAQSIWFTLVSGTPSESPSTLLSELNSRLYASLHTRLQHDNMMTLQLVRHDGDGHFVAAGFHPDILIYRAATRTVERIVTIGAWIGFTDDVADLMADTPFTLDPHDIMVLYTDGLIEAMDTKQEQYDVHRVEATIIAAADQDADSIRESLLADVRKFLHTQDDDISIVVLKRLPVPAELPHLDRSDLATPVHQA